MKPNNKPPVSSSAEPRRRDAGFSLIEIIMVMIIGITVTAFAVPIISSVLSYYRLRSAVSSATWAVQSVRFQALQQGYPFQVAFSGGTGGLNPSYQISSEPIGATSFSNVGSSVPLSGAPVVSGGNINVSVQGQWSRIDFPCQHCTLHIHTYLLRHDRRQLRYQTMETSTLHPRNKRSSERGFLDG